MNTPPSVISASVWENLVSYASVSLVVSRFYPCVHSQSATIKELAAMPNKLANDLTLSR